MESVDLAKFYNSGLERGKCGRRNIGLAICFLLVALLSPSSSLAQSRPAVVLSQSQLVAGFPSSGGALGGGSPAGTNIAITSAGNVIASTTYGNGIEFFITATGTATSLGAYNNPGPVAVDSSDNLYIADVYDTTIVKIPYLAGSYATVANAGTNTPTCTGADTVECVLPNMLVSGIYGFASMTFDASGNLYFSSTNGGTYANAIFKCNAACQKSGTPAATLLYQEPTNPAAQYFVGSLAIDQYGDVFFTDSATNTSNATSTGSTLNELRATGDGATGYSSTATVLYTLTIASPSAYDNQLDGVAVDAQGTVYFATEFDGIFGLLNNHGVVDPTSLFTVSAQGAKILGTDGYGNFFSASYSNATQGDAITKISTAALMAPGAGVGSSSTATATAILNDVVSCAGAPAVSFTSSSADFSAATSGACSTANISNASMFAATITFAPGSAGTRTGTLTATDSAGGSGTAAISATGLTPAATPTFSPAGGTYNSVQTVTISDTDSSGGAVIFYTTDGSMPTTQSTAYNGPITVSTTETVLAIASGGSFSSSAVATALYTVNLPTATPTFSPSGGTYNAAQSITITDTTAGAVIYYTIDGTTPSTASTMYTKAVTVSSTETINAIAVAPGFVASSVGSVTYTIKLPTFALTINPGSLMVSAGGQGLANVNVTGANTFAAAVTFSCSGLPTGATCAFTPTTVTPNGTYTATTVLAVNAPARSGASLSWLALVLGAVLFGFAKRRSFRLASLVVVTCCLLVSISGCSGGNNRGQTATTSMITVTATSGSIVQTASLTLTIQ